MDFDNKTLKARDPTGNDTQIRTTQVMMTYKAWRNYQEFHRDND
jgi:hypothetical protein